MPSWSHEPGPASSGTGETWQQVLEEHAGITDAIRSDVAWVRAVSDHAGESGRRMRIATVTDATTSGGRSRAQAAAQLSRAAHLVEDVHADAFAIGVETDADSRYSTVGELVGYLVGADDTGDDVRRRAGRHGGVDRIAQPPAPRGVHLLRRARGAIVGRRHPARHSERLEREEPSMTVERVVDAHVHLWDPARADWYPFLAGMQELDMGDISGMCRRFDQPTYFSEAAKWNVQKFVHVAAAAAPVLVDETRELDEQAEATGHPDVLIGGLVPSDDTAELERHLDEQMASKRFRGIRIMAEGEQAIPTPAILTALHDRGLIFELMVHPDQLDAGCGRARRLGAAGGRGAHGVAAVERPRGVRALEDGHGGPGRTRGERDVQAVGPRDADAIDGRRDVRAVGPARDRALRRRAVHVREQLPGRRHARDV